MKKYFATLFLIGAVFCSGAYAEEAEKGRNADAAETERQKYQNVLAMKDQSQETYYEQRQKVSLVLGATSLFVNMGSGLGVQATRFSGGFEFSNQMMPGFELGGYAGLVTGFDSSYFGADTMLIPAGLLANYYLHESVYLGMRMGMMLETRGGNPRLDFTMGPQIGTDFRVAEKISIGAEFYVPFVFGAQSFTMFNYSGHARFWF